MFDQIRSPTRDNALRSLHNLSAFGAQSCTELLRIMPSNLYGNVCATISTRANIACKADNVSSCPSTLLKYFLCLRHLCVLEPPTCYHLAVFRSMMLHVHPRRAESSKFDVSPIKSFTTSVGSFRPSNENRKDYSLGPPFSQRYG